jgi:biopolymer transport protein ExbD
MTTNTQSGMRSEINVTPMIDVLLVLLIIFMVIMPAIPKGEAVVAPMPAQKTAAPGSPVVLEVAKAPGGVVFRVNRIAVARQNLESTLEAIYASRAERVLFVQGDDDLSFTQVADAIDIAHAAGADRIGLMTAGTRAASAD